MSERPTYAEIVQEINEIKDFNDLNEWMVLHGATGELCAIASYRNCMISLACIAFEAGKSAGYNDGFNNAAKDPESWYLRDKNGEPMHLGDKAKTSDGIVTITRIYGDVEPVDCLVIGSNEDYGFEYKPWRIEKVIPETREKIVSDMGKAIRAMRFGGEDDEMLELGGNEIAELLFDRIEECVKAEAVD